jgi:hypothetical protein
MAIRRLDYEQHRIAARQSNAPAEINHITHSFLNCRDAILGQPGCGRHNFLLLRVRLKMRGDKFPPVS